MFAADFGVAGAEVVGGRAGVRLGAAFVFVAGLFAAVFVCGCFVAVGAAATGEVTVGTAALFALTFASDGAAGATSVEIAPLVHI